MEIGFWKLTADERVEILAFLIDECVGEAEVIRKYQDDSIERVTDLKKEQRDINRQRKQIASQIADIDKINGDPDAQLISQIDLSNIGNGSEGSDNEYSES
jgi:hypothetical protein